MTRQDSTRPDLTGRDKTRQDKTFYGGGTRVSRQDQTRPDMTGPDATRPDMTRQDFLWCVIANWLARYYNAGSAVDVNTGNAPTIIDNR